MSEVTSDRLAEVCERYVSLVGDDDVEAMMDLFAAECTVEDPVGSETRIGRDAVREFYATLPGAGVSAEMIGPVHAVPDAPAAAFAFVINTAGMAMNAIDVMHFDADAKITSMVAYWKM